MAFAVYGRNTERALALRGIKTYPDPEAKLQRRLTIEDETEKFLRKKQDDDRKRRLSRKLELLQSRKRAEKAVKAKMPLWMFAICEKRCNDFDAPVAAILHKSRRSNIAYARQAVYHDLLGTPSPITRKPLTSTQIAHIFGVDHGTVLYGAAIHAYRNGLASNSNFDIERRISRTRKWHAKQRELRASQGINLREVK